MPIELYNPFEPDPAVYGFSQTTLETSKAPFFTLLNCLPHKKSNTGTQF